MRRRAEPPRGLYIAEVAHLVGVSPAAIRAWEAEGLIRAERTPAGYRIYTPQDVERLRHIRDLLQRDGLNAAGVRKLLLPESNGAPSESPRVGDRLRSFRKRQATSLRALAAQTGLSPSYISALERSISNPSVASLQKLAAALNTNVPTLLGESPEPHANPVVRVSERPVLKMETPGVVFENLYRVETNLQPILITVEPGAGSQESYRHEGEAFLYILEGKLSVVLDEVYEYELGPGHSLTFASDRPHRWRNPGTEPAVIVWVNTPPTF